MLPNNEKGWKMADDSTAIMRKMKELGLLPKALAGLAKVPLQAVMDVINCVKPDPAVVRKLKKFLGI